MANGINVLSLFDGISCGRVALERAGIQVENYFASEIEKSAILISQHNYPDIIQIGDVKSIDVDSVKNLPEISLVIAGSPCQGFSRGGKGLNFEDPRSKLFFKFVEVLGLIRKYNNPNVLFLLENVKMKNEWRDTITNHMGVEPVEINSKLVSAQNRPRMYWSNIGEITEPENKNIKLLDILESDVFVDYLEVNDVKICKSFSEASRNLVKKVGDEIRVAQSVKRGYAIAEEGDGINISFPTSKSRRGRVIKGKSSTLDRACNIGVLSNNVIRRFTLTELERLQTLPDGYTDVHNVSISARKGALGNGWTVDVIAHIFKGLKQ